MKAMILAAGLGERLKPLTNSLPKPLIEVAGKPLIVHHLEKLAHAGIIDVIINVSHLASKIQEALKGGDAYGLNIQYSVEDTPLETAGGIQKALPLLGDEPFLLISADIFTDYTLNTLIQVPSAAHLVMVPNPKHHPNGDFGLKDHLLSFTSPPYLTFSGLAKFAPTHFQSLTPGKRPLRTVLNTLIEQQLITGELYHGFWTDVGTPERLHHLQQTVCSPL